MNRQQFVMPLGITAVGGLSIYNGQAQPNIKSPIDLNLIKEFVIAGHNDLD